MSGFKKATKTKVKARIAIDGPSGSGKTWTGLTTAHALAGPDGKVAVIDSERGSASLYADRFDFDVLELQDFNTRRYIKAINEAAAAGYDALVIDSLSHAWGYVLDEVDKAKSRFGNNSYMAWSVGTPLWNELIQAILTCPMHVVVTMRSKSKFVEEQNDKGKTTYKRAGTEPVARDGVEFEFTIVADMDLDHNLIISKTRCGDAVPTFYREPGAEFGQAVKAWLEDGKDAPVPFDHDAEWARMVAYCGDESTAKGFVGMVGLKSRSELADEEKRDAVWALMTEAKADAIQDDQDADTDVHPDQVALDVEAAA